MGREGGQRSSAPLQGGAPEDFLLIALFVARCCFISIAGIALFPRPVSGIGRHAIFSPVMDKFRILCFGDSNTWGYTPGTGRRLPEKKRWTSVMQEILGGEYEVIPEGLSGRTVDVDDQFWRGRNASKQLPRILQKHAPLSLVILMLGTNDLKERFDREVEEIARGAGKLVDLIRASRAGPSGIPPRVLLVAPPELTEATEERSPEFFGAALKSSRLAAAYRTVAEEHECLFLNAALLAAVSTVDGVHLESSEHARLGGAIARLVRRIR